MPHKISVSHTSALKNSFVMKIRNLIRNLILGIIVIKQGRSPKPEYILY